ncbi:hypothetical protein F0562_009795 [Nyssa sinensis]|uniref:Uncharacterized protein n=1 Tax=Nyssa sinensis TaxID=561372 RepID=A0A5J5A0W4_9ASTE|nr:hypothetical protein F0562_009795 [Nyssa sinensis]
MIKRQKSLRLLSFLIRPDHHRRWGCCFMAPAASLLLGNNDPLLSKGLHFFHRRHHHQHQDVPYTIERFRSLGKMWSAVDSTGGYDAGLLRTNGRCINRLIVKGCYDNRKRVDNNTSDNANIFEKTRIFARNLQRLVRDCDSGRLLEDERDARLANGHDSVYHRGGPLGFPDQPLPEKVVVAVDVDEVLGNFVSALNRFIADRYSLNHSVSEYHVYEFFKIWNCSRDEADIRVHEFFKTSYFKMGIHPIPGARQTLQKLSGFCNLSVVTSRQNAIKDDTIEWIEKYFPGLFQEIHFGNHFALDGQSRSKSDICRSLGAKVLIDDNPRYAIECAEVGIRVLLFDYENSYPWCKTESVDQHPLVTKVHNWKEVERQLISWSFT